MNTIKQLYASFVFIILFIAVGTNSTYSQGKLDKNELSYTESIRKAIHMVEDYPDESFEILEEMLIIAYEEKDTSSIINCLIGITDIERFRGNYNEAFDQLWEALLLAEKAEQTLHQVRIHRNIGILYGIYNKDSSAVYHLHQSLNKIDKLKDQPRLVKGQMVSTYFSLASVYKDNGEYEKALQYLDSCVSVSNSNNLSYTNTDRGYIYLQLGKYNRAETSLRIAKRELEEKDARYLVANYLYLGDLKMAQNNADSALYYYTKSLETLKRKKTYVEYKSELLQKLSAIYHQKKKYNRAYTLLNESKAATDSLFNAKNERNNQLFLIKNKYKEELIKQEQLVAEQNQMIREKSQAQFRLRITIVVILLLASLGYWGIRMQTKVKKLKLTQQLEHEKNNEILEVKSKELTAYALKMIEKERAINVLLENIKANSPKEYAPLKKKYAKETNNLWEEFHMRFIKVNGSFYDKLREQHPDLSPTEQKHCALIRLNFDSPEMAQILNISLQSVHTSRYRIRKKLKLEHGESLSDYIGTL